MSRAASENMNNKYFLSRGFPRRLRDRPCPSKKCDVRNVPRYSNCNLTDFLQREPLKLVKIQICSFPNRLKAGFSEVNKSKFNADLLHFQKIM